MTIFKRGKTYHLRQRVPLRYKSVEPRAIVGISLHTDSESVARTKAAGAWENLVEGWEARLAGDTSDAEKRFAAAQELAAVRGFRYLPASKTSALPTDEWLARVEAVPERNGKPDMREAAAILGAVEEPPITVSRALELYWGLAADRTHGKSEDQLRRWKNPRKKAIANFIEVIGDMEVAQIAGDDMLEFRNWWIEKLNEEKLTPNSANKDLIHLGDVLKTVNRMKRLGLVLPLSDLALKKGEAKPYPPFSSDWIRDKILAPGALDGLNDEARAVLLAMVNTGARPSELVALTDNTIHLQHNVPHISIEPEGRTVKSHHARRVIPLTGVSLEAFRQFPDGFPRYRNKPTISATVNKYMRAHGLMETPEHVMYSLRHSFEDRMLAAGVDDRIRRDVFGHRLTREKYGKGASLDHLQKVVQAIAF